MSKKLFIIFSLCFLNSFSFAEELYDGTIDSPPGDEEGLPSASTSSNQEVNSSFIDNNKGVIDDQQEDHLLQLETQLRDLRGKMEELKHEVKLLSKNQTEALENTSTKESSSSVAEKENKKTFLSEEEEKEEGSTLKEGPALKRYEEAQGYLAQQAYPEAERALKDIIHHYPNDPLAVNAHYWLGETYYIQKDFGHAAVSFANAYKSYKKIDQSKDKLKDKETLKISAAKAPEALVKLALSLKALKKDEQACVTLEQLRSEFPHLPQNVKKLAEQAEQGLQQCKNPTKG
jgi:TolA-binding protein